ncbi:MAG: hypothetical protein ACK6CT_03810 [Planctomycetia bacterium]
MKTAVLGLGVVLVAAGIAGVVAYADRDEDERVEELMEKTHEGKRSPYRQLRTQAEAPEPSWQAVERTLPRFEAMSKALRESTNPDIKGSADGYVDAVKEIAAAAKQQDAKLLRAGFRALSESCGDCHFKGGVGGELDD